MRARRYGGFMLQAAGAGNKDKVRVVISGYYGFSNVGDEAVLAAILQLLARKFPEAEPVVFSACPPDTEAAHGVRAVNRWHAPSVWRELASADILISGGGSLFQDATSLRSLLYYAGVILMAKAARCRVAVLAQGMGPLRSRLSRRLTRWVLNGVDLVSVRDDGSRRLLEQIGVAKQVILTSDPAFAFAPGPGAREEGERLLRSAGAAPGAGRMVGVAVRRWERWPVYAPALGRVLSVLAREGWQVVFIPFKFPEDVSASREIADMMGEQSYIVDRRGSIGAYFGLMEFMDLMIAVRLHALIMGAVAGVPCVGISYDPKVDSFVSSLGQIRAGPEGEVTADHLKDRVYQAISCSQELSARAKRRAQELGSLVEDVFARVRELV